MTDVDNSIVWTFMVLTSKDQYYVFFETTENVAVRADGEIAQSGRAWWQRAVRALDGNARCKLRLTESCGRVDWPVSHSLCRGVVMQIGVPASLG